MVVDSSALAAVLFGEEDRTRFVRALASSERKLMSSVNYSEIGIVAESRKGSVGGRTLAGLISLSGIDVVAFDSSQAEIALDAWRRYGKGRRKAGLNFGDCAAYALSKVSNEPLLFKGGDFLHTDAAEY